MTELAPPLSAATIRPLGEPGDLGWIVMANAELYASEYGWDASFERLTLRIVADFADEPAPAPETGAPPPPRAGWIAELDGERVGCVLCVPGPAADVALLRLLMVAPHARGQSLGTRLIDRTVAFARQAGYDRLRLWTNHPLTAARRLYLAAGFTLTGEQPHRSFGAELVGQTYELALSSADPRLSVG